VILACVASVAALGCGSSPRPGTSAVWTFSPDGYFSDDSFAESHFAADTVLIHDRDDFGGQLTAIDAATGATLWQRTANWAAHPDTGLDPLWIVDDPANADHREIIRLDPRSGAELERVALVEPLPALDDRLAWADGALLAFSYGRLRAIDVVTGAAIWSIEVERDYRLFAPVVRGHTALLVGDRYLALDAKSGAERWRFDGACCTARQSPHGRELYLAGPEGAWARLDWDGTIRGRGAGEVRAVSDRYVAVAEQGRLAVYPHGSDRAAWVRPTTDEDFVTAVTLSGSNLFYFSAADDTLWRRDVDRDHVVPVVKAHGHFVIGTERGQTGMSEPFIGAPPAYAPPYLFVLEFSSIRAFRLDG
jgi:hypothetical protein